MYYVTDALTEFKQLEDQLTKIKHPSSIFFKEINSLLIKSEKFLIPDPKSLKVHVTSNAVPFIKMPYPIMALEYSVPYAEPISSYLPTKETTLSTKRIALVIDAEKIDTSKLILPPVINKGIIVVSIYYTDNLKKWTPSFGCMLFDPNEKQLTQNLEIDNHHYKMVANPIAFNPRFFDAAYNTFTPAHILKMITNDVTEELASALKTIVALNSKNTGTIDFIASAKQNKRRLIRKKLPYFDYKLIDVFLNTKKKYINATRTSVEELRTMLSNTRLHSVIGHFKIRKTGMFWWSPHVRGNHKKGIILKEYNVHDE